MYQLVVELSVHVLMLLAQIKTLEYMWERESLFHSIGSGTNGTLTLPVSYNEQIIYSKSTIF